MFPYHKTHFIFDVDDTLTDSYSFNQQMFVDTFTSYLDISKPEIDKYLRNLHYHSRGTPMTSQFQEAINHFSLNLPAARLTAENEALHLRNVDRLKTFDAVTDIIKKLKQTHRQISVCTNRQTSSLMKILKNNGLESCFSHIVSCADAGHNKPDPYCLEQIIQNSHQPRKDFIYFGDSQTDYLFAKNAGIDFIIIDHYLNQKKFYRMIIESFM
jgi:FMN phosphatase YigB (HAD superfamily)